MESPLAGFLGYWTSMQAGKPAAKRVTRTLKRIKEALRLHALASARRTSGPLSTGFEPANGWCPATDS